MYISSNFRFEDECRSSDVHLNVWIKGQPRILLGAYLLNAKTSGVPVDVTWDPQPIRWAV